MSLKTDQRLKILCVTAHPPGGRDSGPRLRVRNLFRLLNQFGEVRLVLAGPYEQEDLSLCAKPGALKISERIDFEDAPVRGIGARLRHEFGARELNFYGKMAGAEATQKLEKLAAESDLIWFHTLRVANAFGRWHWPGSILDIDDVPSRYYQSVRGQVSGGIRKLRMLRQERLWKRHESRLLERFSAVAVCSEPDRAYLGGADRIFVLPNGFEVPAEIPVAMPSDPPRIGFIANLEYAPNRNGLSWFIREVWPLIRQKIPAATLRLAGKLSDASEWRTMENVQGLGWLADADAEMATWALTVVPLFEGGGTRVKISAAFSRKCPVVSTRLGAYGYEVANDHELLLADSAPEFAAACLRILKDGSVGRRLAQNAWEAFLQKWTWEANLPQLEKMVRLVVDRREAGAVPA